MLHLIHYGKREHVEKFFEDGSIQIGTVRSYDTATHGPMIGDDEEGISHEFITDDNIATYLEQGRPMPIDPLGIGLPLFGGPGSYGNVLHIKNISHNYAIFCMTSILHQKICQDFDTSYDAAIYIDRPFPFFHELTRAFEESKLTESVNFRDVADVIYRERNLIVGEMVLEQFIKPMHYQHQRETRAIWNIGNPTEKYYRFKAPKAALCCRKVLVEDMPDYAPGELSPQQFDQVMRKALKY